MRKIVIGVVALVVGLGLLGYSAYLLTAAPVMCGNEVMQPGNTCTLVDKGQAADHSYDQQRSAQHTDAYYAAAPGVIAFGYGIFALVTARRSDDTEDEYATEDFPATPAA
jgi:hypothetical protein